ncbi:amidohydrolase family protein [Frankia sp. QA3]|uniref:amidohydrolase family protein n=1 Tax=Frankia sp. QA3 TaxID=710111 RepID=UPI000269C0B5|nr:amidohydrolase family protein [Frankia sp. QA3]EIV91588.1 putative TIM-barrel fold metal-dependent hydrolase [Frankia sp. QA3]
MPLRDTHQIVSVDDHLVEHPKVWLDRLPAKFGDRIPRIEEQDGKHVWVYDGVVFPTIGLNAVAGREPRDWGLDPMRFEEMIPGCYDPVARLKDMDLDGVHAALCFPSFPGFAGGVFHRAQDKELALACIQGWNDFMVDEWCAAAPDRYIPLSLLPVWDVAACVAEVERAAAKGSRTVSFPDSPVPLGLPSFHSNHWEPLWDVCEATDVSVSLHFGSGSFVPGFSFAASKPVPGGMTVPDAPFAVAIASFATNLMWTTIDLLFSGVLQRHPKLQFALSEGGIGWLPYILERCDQTWEKHRWYQKDIDFDTRPSDLFRKHFWGCFIEDKSGLRNRHEIGIDRIMLEIDYPHSDSTWPNSRKIAADLMQDIPDDEVAKIVEDNARTLYRFPRS